MSGKVANLNCYSFNATSLKRKLHEFNSHFHGVIAEYQVVAMSETWFDDDVDDNEILYNCNRNIFRNDRDP